MLNRVENLIENLERVRAGVCCYVGPTCDCKYGFPSDRRPGTEQTGCPEIREAIGFLRQLNKLTASREPLLTFQEWDDAQRVLRVPPVDSGVVGGSE